MKKKKQDNKIILYIIRRVVVKFYSNYQKTLVKLGRPVKKIGKIKEL